MLLVEFFLTPMFKRFATTLITFFFRGDLDRSSVRPELSWMHFVRSERRKVIFSFPRVWPMGGTMKSSLLGYEGFDLLVRTDSKFLMMGFSVSGSCRIFLYVWMMSMKRAY